MKLEVSQVFQSFSTSSKMSQQGFKKINLFNCIKSWQDPHTEKSEFDSF